MYYEAGETLVGTYEASDFCQFFREKTEIM